MGTNIGFFVGSAPDHDMYPTHLENEQFKAGRDWGEQQCRHSANFCNSSNFITRFMGGINYQIEHHLFPSLCNHHLRAISPIVQRTCLEFGVPYVSVDSPSEVLRQVIHTYMEVHETDGPCKQGKPVEEDPATVHDVHFMGPTNQFAWY